MKVKAILFDLDGVLLDTEKIYHKYWKQAAAEFGYDLADEIFLQLRSCDSSIARRIVDTAAGVDGAYDRIRERRKELMKDSAQKDGFELKDGVTEFLSAIRDLPVRKAIVTASSLEKPSGIEREPLLPRTRTFIPISAALLIAVSEYLIARSVSA